MIDDNVDLLADANTPAPNTNEVDADTDIDNSNTLLDLIKDETIKNSATAQKFKDVDSIVKSYEELQKKLGSRIQDLSADELKELDKKFDVPESLEGYGFEDSDGEAITELRNTMLEAGISKNQATKFDKLLRDNIEVETKDNDYNHKLSLEQSKKNLEAHYGLAYSDKINLANEAMHEIADEDQIKHFKEVGFTSDPEFIKTMAKVGDIIGEDKLNFKSKTREFNMEPEDIQTQIDSMVSKDGISTIISDPILSKKFDHLHVLKSKFKNLR